VSGNNLMVFDRYPSIQEDVYGPNIFEKTEKPKIWQVYSRRTRVGPSSGEKES